MEMNEKGGRERAKEREARVARKTSLIPEGADEEKDS